MLSFVAFALNQQSGSNEIRSVPGNRQSESDEITGRHAGWI